MVGTIIRRNAQITLFPLVIDISMDIINDEDIGFIGYWAIDNFTGALSTQAGAVELGNACGKFDAVITGSFGLPLLPNISTMPKRNI